MAYNKTTWSSGDKISAVKLNNIENGVEVLSDSLTNMQNLHVYYKQPADFGGLAEDDIGTMISKMNNYSTVKLWINNSDSFLTIYNWVLAGINADVDASVTYVYGIVTIEVTGSCARIIFEPYDATERYEINYSSVNDVGWGKWTKYVTCGIKEISGTTTENGNMLLEGLDATHMVIGVSCTNSVALHPYISSNGKWYVHTTNASTNANVISTALTVKVAYMEL